MDFGDIDAGHTVTALYEVIPVGQSGWLNDSRYQKTPKVGSKSNEYGFLNLRFKRPNQGECILLTQAISNRSVALNRANKDTQFAVMSLHNAQQLKMDYTMFKWSGRVLSNWAKR